MSDIPAFLGTLTTSCKTVDTYGPERKIFIHEKDAPIMITDDPHHLWDVLVREEDRFLVLRYKYVCNDEEELRREHRKAKRHEIETRIQERDACTQDLLKLVQVPAS